MVMQDKKDRALNRDSVRANLLSYTRKAFSFLPKLDNPRILDIGCGTHLFSLGYSIRARYAVGLSGNLSVPIKPKRGLSQQSG